MVSRMVNGISRIAYGESVPHSPHSDRWHRRHSG
jgi:hypothetical protein